MRADLLFFPFGGKDQHAWHFSTCGHVRISAQNSHVVGLVQNIAWTCFFISEHFGTPLPSDVSFSSVSTQTLNGGGAIIESVYAYAPIMAGPFGAN